MSVQDISNDKNYLQNSVADPDFQRRGWWGGGGMGSHSDREKRGGAASPKPRASVCSNNKERARPPPPSCPSPGSATEIIYNPVKLREF